MKSYDVISIGSATRDVFLTSSGIRVLKTKAFMTGRSISLPLGEKVEVQDIVFDTGGGGTNAAVAFARQGFRTAFLGKIGAGDSRGEQILKVLRGEHVDTSLVCEDRRAMTAFSVLLMTPKAERSVLVYRGASAHLTQRDIPAGRLRSRWLYLSTLGGNYPLLRRLLAIAAAQRMKVAMNPGHGELQWGLSKFAPLLRQLSVLILNQEEASLLTGLPYQNETRMFKSLCFHLPGIVVITAGKRGAMVCDNAKKYLVLPHPVKIRNRTGAGDAFGSGFVAGLLRRPRDIPFALQLGAANAEAVIQPFGAKHGLLRRVPPPRQRCRVHVVAFPNP